MKAKTTIGPAASGTRGPRDPQIERALLEAMKGALRRSIVLLPLTEDEDRLQECLESFLGVST